MKIAGSLAAGFVFLLIMGAQSGCGLPDEIGAADVTDHYARALIDTPAPAANPPPDSCVQRRSGVTGIQVLVRINEYQGLIRGRNGTHEIAYGTITNIPWVYDDGLLDTHNAQLALNVKSTKNPSGLPYEIKLVAGDLIEVEGEYIPAATSGASNENGAAAVIHFTHNPCGYVSVRGNVYR